MEKKTIIYSSAFQFEKLGWLYLYASQSKLLGIYFSPQEKNLKVRFPNSKIVKNSSNFIIEKTKEQLIEYFSGKRKTFQLPLYIQGTPFQQKVWKTLLRIPYGKKSNYSEVAQKSGFTHAVRAVGTANGANHFPIVIPCHRVIQKSGKIGNYSGGIKIKNFLLDLET